MGKFDADHLMNAVGGEDGMQQMCIDKGSNFLNGKITSTFNTIQTSESTIYVLHTTTTDGKEKIKKFIKKEEAERALKTANEEAANAPKTEDGNQSQPKNYIEETKSGSAFNNAANIAANVTGMAETIQSAPQVVNGIITEVNSIIMSEVQKRVAEVTQLAATLALTTPSKISSYSQKKFNEEKTTLAQELAKLNKGLEKHEEEEQTKSQEKADKAGNKDIQEKLGALKTSVDKITKETSDKVEMIAQYAAEGPDWIETQINTTIDEKLEAIDGMIRDKKQSITATHDKFCKGQGDVIGEKMAKQYNLMMERTAKNQFDKIEKSKRELSIKAFALKQKLNLKLMGLTGMNIPI